MHTVIRKFEEIGTHPAANYLAIAAALTFHQGLGAERKAARLRYLRDYWAHRLLEHAEFEGLRISPNVFTTLEELDRVVDAMETVIREGLPG